MAAITKNTVFDTYKIQHDYALVYDIENDLLNHMQVSFKIAKSGGHLFIEMLQKTYEAIQEINVGAQPIDINYYNCDLKIGKIKTIQINGIVFPIQIWIQIL